MSTIIRIISFLIYNLKKDSVIEFLHTFITKAETCPSITLYLPTWLQALKNSFAEAERVYNITLKSPVTQLISENDAQRDGIVTSMKALVRSFEKSESAEEREAARVLMVGLSSLKYDRNDLYFQQTGQIDNLLNFLTVQESQAVETLQMTQMVQLLKSVNTRMHELIECRVEEIANKELNAFANAREKAEHDYTQLIDSINSWARLNTDNLDEGASEEDGTVSMRQFILWSNGYIEFMKRKVLKVPATVVEEEVDDAEDSEGEGTEGEGNDNENTNPGGNETPGGDNEDGENEGDNNTNPGETTAPDHVRAFFIFANGEEETISGLPGSPMQPPINTVGYMWQPAPPRIIPMKDTTYREVVYVDDWK